VADPQTPAPVQEDTYTVPCTYSPDFHRFVLSCSIEQFERCQHDEEDPRSVSYHANLELFGVPHHLDFIPVLDQEQTGDQRGYPGFRDMYAGMQQVYTAARYATITINGRPFVAVLTPHED
jgi:hypothetical protein